MSPTVKSVIAVVTGFVVVGALAIGSTAVINAISPGQFDANGLPTTPTHMVLNILYIGAFATFGCWLTGRMAPSRPMMHALIVGVLGLALNLSTGIPLWGSVPTWYLAASIVGTMVWAWLGGRLAERGGGEQVAVA